LDVCVYMYVYIYIYIYIYILHEYINTYTYCMNICTNLNVYIILHVYTYIYAGMTAIVADVRIEWDVGIVAASVVIALVSRCSADIDEYECTYIYLYIYLDISI
jgi:NO-binding membrane sensor protein with MHYT domain